MFKKLLVLGLSFSLTSCFADTHKQLSSYTEIANALSNGSHLQIISQLSQCTPQKISNIQVAGAEFTHFLIYTTDSDGKKSNVIGMSNTIPIHHKEYGYVDDYIRVHISEDNSVEFFSQLLNSKDHTSLNRVDTETVYNCQLGAGVKIYEL